MTTRPLLPIIALVALASGCTGARTSPTWPHSLPLGSNMVSFRAGPSTKQAGNEQNMGPITGDLTMRRALAAALWRNPALRAAAWTVRMRRAQTRQAGLGPNPTIDFSAEDFGVNADLRGADDMELTVGFSQVIPLGSDLQRRRRVAALEAESSGWDYEATRLAVLAETMQAFVRVAAIQELIGVTKTRKALLTRILEMFRQRVASGHIASKDIGLVRARIRLERTKMALGRLQDELTAARYRLAAQWGSVRPRFRRVVGDIPMATSLPPLRRLLDKLDTSPLVRSLRTKLKASKAAVMAAKAVPDLTVRAGLRVLPANGSVGFVAGLSIPIPILDRNQGAISAAKHRVMRQKALLGQVKTRVAARLAQAHQKALSEAATLSRLGGFIMPQARLAVETAMEAYRAGKENYLAVLDAEQTLLSLRTERLTASTELFVALSRIELLLGVPLHRIEASKAPSHPARFGADTPGPQERPKGVPATEKGTGTAQRIPRRRIPRKDEER